MKSKTKKKHVEEAEAICRQKIQGDLTSHPTDVRFTRSLRALIETFGELWMRQGSASVDIHTLVQELRDKVDRYNPQRSGFSIFEFPDLSVTSPTDPFP